MKIGILLIWVGYAIYAIRTYYSANDEKDYYCESSIKRIPNKKPSKRHYQGRKY